MNPIQALIEAAEAVREAMAQLDTNQGHYDSDLELLIRFTKEEGHDDAWRRLLDLRSAEEILRAAIPAARAEMEKGGWIPRAGSVEHLLKTLPLYWEQLRSGKKTFELRRNDRDFQVGDTLKCWNFDPAFDWSTDPVYDYNVLWFGVTYVLKDCPDFGLADGFCIMGLTPLPAPPKENTDVDQS